MDEQIYIEMLDAMDAYQAASHEEAIARAAHDGYSWDWYGEDFIEAKKKSATAFIAAFKSAVAHAVKQNAGDTK